MNATIIGKQFVITQAIRTYVEQHLEVLTGDASMKIGSVKVVMEREKNRFTTSLVVNCKYHTFTAVVEDFDLYRTFDAALDKVSRQLYNLNRRVRDHHAVPLCDMEQNKAVQAQEVYAD